MAKLRLEVEAEDNIPTRRNLAQEFDNEAALQEDVAWRRAIAARIKALRNLRAAGREAGFPAVLDAEIEHARKQTRSGQPASNQQMEEAMSSLAECKVHMERAENHLARALEQRDKPQLNLNAAEQEFNELRAARKSRGGTGVGCDSGSARQCVLSSASQLATALSSMREKAAPTEDGRMVVDPLYLKAIANLTQQLAAGPALTQQPETMPSGPPTCISEHQEQDVEDCQMVQTDEYLSYDEYRMDSEAGEPEDSEVRRYLQTWGFLDPGRPTCRHLNSSGACPSRVIPLIRLNGKQKPTIKEMKTPASRRGYTTPVHAGSQAASSASGAEA